MEGWAVGGRDLQREYYQYNSLNRLAVLVLLMLAFSGLVFLLLSPSRIVIKGIRQFSISMHSDLQADYSPDLHAIPLSPVELDLIGEALEDRNNPDEVPEIIVELNIPIPTVTPFPTLPGVLPTPPLFPTLPGLPPTATLMTITLTSTPTPTGTITRTPTRTPTEQVITTAPPATSTPTPPNTVTPTHTSVPPTPVPPTRTHTRTPTIPGYPYPPSATVAPTNTQPGQPSPTPTMTSATTPPYP